MSSVCLLKNIRELDAGNTESDNIMLTNSKAGIANYVNGLPTSFSKFIYGFILGIFWKISNLQLSFDKNKKCFQEIRAAFILER